MTEAVVVLQPPGTVYSMLFNSYDFLVLFLPGVLAVFLLLIALRRRRGASLWLTAASLYFYAYWDWRYLPLLIVSMSFNYLVGRRLSKSASRPLFLFAVIANVLLLGYYKYTEFFVGALASALDAPWSVPHIVLPLAISFFTFQQIAYLSDAYDGAAEEHDFANYCLFITFFPHLIAGPITHHREMLPQFTDENNFRPRWDHFCVGITLFLIGLFKKVEIADRLSVHVGIAFDAVSKGAQLSVLDGWGGALAYTLQIYFDFSGYTDMAIGLGMLFCIRLPQNFDSPYKARSVIEFWSRWHMTLTRFLTAYVYNPITMGITRARVAAGKPLPRRGKMSLGAWASLVAAPTIFTMFVSGLWHGAGWQYIVFGLLHGFFLTVNHAWRALKMKYGWRDAVHPAAIAGSVLLTFSCVILGLIFFRARDVPTAVRLLEAMAGKHGFSIDFTWFEIPLVWRFTQLLGLPEGGLLVMKVGLLLAIPVLLAWVWFLPNAQQVLRLYPTALQNPPRPTWLQRALPRLTWRPTFAMGLTAGGFGFILLLRALSAAPTEFLYFQF